LFTSPRHFGAWLFTLRANTRYTSILSSATF
jgi:hypothetical protein